jgi:UDP-glucose 4-epimerase
MSGIGQDSRVLVTGCCGFIGKHLVASLLNIKGVLIYGVDTAKKLNQFSPPGLIKTQENFVKLPVDLTDMTSCLDLPDVDYVFHLAAINGTQLFYEIPWDVFYNSGLSTINLISRYKDCKTLKKFIYTSSSEVYADLVSTEDQNLKTDESTTVGFRDVFNARWSYGGAKLLGEIGVISAGHQYNFPFTILRYHNVYGPAMGINHVMPDFIDRGKIGSFELHGGENIRSFIYISDAIEATILSANSKEADTKIVHIGTMNPVSMTDLAKMIMQISKWKGEIKIHPAPLGSTNFRCPDTTFLNSTLGFTPKVTLQTGLRLLLDDKGVI